MNLFISPHNDDETLFGAFTLMREKPLVVIVTDSWIQANRGDNNTADQRWEETKAAMAMIGLSVIRLGIRDDIISEWHTEEKLRMFTGFNKVYAPAIQGGNPHHDLIGKIAQDIFGDKVIQYSTYAPGEFYTKGLVEIAPVGSELIVKEKMLTCYKSQLALEATKPHFEAVKDKPEWLM